MKTESRNFLASARVNPAMAVLVVLLVGFVVLIPYVYIQVQRALDADQSYLQHAAELRAQSYQLTALSRVAVAGDQGAFVELDRKSTRLNSSHVAISYAVFCLKKK